MFPYKIKVQVEAVTNSYTHLVMHPFRSFEAKKNSTTEISCNYNPFLLFKTRDYG